MIYSVTYFNPIGNCDNTVHVEADSEFEAAFIAHCSHCTSKSFNPDNYQVYEYDESSIIKKEDILKDMPLEQVQRLITNAKKDYVVNLWKSYYKYADEPRLQKLLEEANKHFDISDLAIVKWVNEYERSI